MRILFVATALMIAAAAPATAQSAPATAAPAGSGHYDTSTTELGTILDDPAAKAIVEKHIPGMTTDEQVDMARGMTLKAVQQYSPDAVTDKALAAIDVEFAKLPAKPSSSAK